MSAANTKSDLPINPANIRWARKEVGLSIEEAAAKVPVKSDKLAEWELGDRKPTVNQARKLAKIYDRPFLEFLSSEKPTKPKVNLAADFRQLKDPPSRRDEAAREAIQGWAETQRLNALDLLEMIGEPPPELPAEIFANGIEENAEIAAARVRAAIGFGREEQIGIRQKDRRLVPERLRAKMSEAGILVLRKSGLRAIGVRGICLFAKPLPIVVYHAQESPGAQAFTLAHELGHVALKSRAFSGLPVRRDSDLSIEKWCNQFSASFLIPATIISEFIPRPNEPAAAIDFEVLDGLAAAFSVSSHAMLIRLVTLKYVKSDFYWNTARADFLAAEAEYKSPPMRSKYHTRYKNSLGNFYTGLVLEAWGNGAISGHNAAEFLGIKNVRHLADIHSSFPN